ncbi:MAG: serine hydrolase [Candidatus Dormibacteraeota bacterium]|nr:serine hydrolase [Candidatus Dormibacteraeota bacterium]
MGGPGDDRTPPLPPRLAGRVEAIEREFTGTVALWCHDLTTRRTFGLRATQRFDPASTIKLFILRELYRQRDAGQLRLDETLTVARHDVVPGSGVLKDLTPGRVSLTLHDLATLMVTVSDNVATNLLIGRLGASAVNRGARLAGFEDTFLRGKLFKGRTRSSHTTPRDLGALMTQIARRQAVSRPASNEMLDILRREQSDFIVGRFLPYTREELEQDRQPWKIASKSGSIKGHRHDVALVEGHGHRYVLAVMSSGSEDLRFWPDNEGTLALAHIAFAVHQEVTA